MNDFLGHKLLEGDKVLYIRCGYREFKKGKITKINAKKVNIDPLTTGVETVRYGCDVIFLERTMCGDEL